MHIAYIILTTKVDDDGTEERKKIMTNCHTVEDVSLKV